MAIGTRMARKKVKKKRKTSKFLSLLLILFLTIVGYAVYEYNAGFQNASGGMPSIDENGSDDENKNVEEFQGKKDKDGKINVLLLGVDSATSNKSRTDTIMVAQYDTNKGTAKLASIMRDSYVSIPGHSDNKINSAYYVGGVELLRQTIKENFGIDVEYYAQVNFDGFTEVIDVLAPKGIEIDVEKTMKYDDFAGNLHIDLQEGVQRLNGKELLGYARFRKDSENDFGRVRRQQQVISAVKEQLISVKGIVKLPRILGTIEPYVNTNLSKADLLWLGKDILLNPAKEIESIRIPIDDSFEFKSYSHAGSVIAFNKEENKQALKEFFQTSEPKETVAMKKKDEKNTH